jgi:hypothetical protein
VYTTIAMFAMGGLAKANKVSCRMVYFQDRS